MFTNLAIFALLLIGTGLLCGGATAPASAPFIMGAAYLATGSTLGLYCLFNRINKESQEVEMSDLNTE